MKTYTMMHLIFQMSMMITTLLMLALLAYNQCCQYYSQWFLSKACHEEVYKQFRS